MRVLFLLVFLGSCKALPGPVNPPTGNFCEAAEKNLLVLQCRIDGDVLGAPNRHGETFAQVCLRVERAAMVDMRAECLADARDCEEVRQCNTN